MRSNNQSNGEGVVVVGGGLAGLVTATLLARNGASVTLVEKSARLGGRAQTTDLEGAKLNLGPHAIYAKGHGQRVLRDLGIPIRGKLAPSAGSTGLAGGAIHTLPVGVVSLLATSLLSLGEKLDAARTLSLLSTGAPGRFEGLTTSRMLDELALTDRVRAWVEAILRVTSYAHAPELSGARAALDQLVAGLGGVLYLDGGWQSLVDALEARARELGVRRVEGRARALETKNGHMRAVVVDERVLETAAVVLALGPSEAAALAPESATLQKAASEMIPVRAACLDLVLRSLPPRSVQFCLGIDRPLYFSVHSRVAELAPLPGAVIHVAKYLAPGDASGNSGRAELEDFAELVMPGLGERVAYARYLPRMTVSNALVGVAGLSARPAPGIPEVGGLFIAGDWVGARGQLADAAIASAEKCAKLIHAHARDRAA